MATWYAQRFLTTDRHPVGQEFREAYKADRAAFAIDTAEEEKSKADLEAPKEEMDRRQC
jgi:hypothetical protein